MVIVVGTIDLKTHEVIEGGVSAEADQIIGEVAKLFEFVEWEVDAITGGVFGEIAKDVCDLKSYATVFGKFLRLFEIGVGNVIPDGGAGEANG